MPVPRLPLCKPNKRIETDLVGLWTPQDDKILKNKSVVPLRCPLYKLDDEEQHQNRIIKWSHSFALLLTVKRSSPQRLMLHEYSLTEFKSTIYLVCVYSVYGSFRLFIHGQMQPNKSIQNHRGPALHGGFPWYFSLQLSKFHLHWNYKVI